MRNPLKKLTKRPISVAVTGLSQAGKTVFLTSLIDHLVQGGEESLERFAEEDLSFSGRSLPVPPGRKRFPYRRNMEKLRGNSPDWPEPTSGISEFRLELAVRRGTRRKCRRMELRLVDYPGERLLDLLLEKDFGTWSEENLRRARTGARSELSGDWLQESGSWRIAPGPPRRPSRTEGGPPSKPQYCFVRPPAQVGMPVPRR